MKKLSLLLSLAVLLFSALTQANDEPQPEPVSEAELAQILAPIALYPDTLLSHILIASTYPIEVVKAERWTRENPDIKGRDAVEAVEDEDWDPSVKALTAFPKILEKMSEDLDWTQKLGETFLAEEERTLAMVQTLRQKAKAAGNLDKFEYLDVTEEDDAIIIEPRHREVIYVPYYDTRVVYGPWYWSAYPPLYWHYPSIYHVDHYYPGRVVYWGPRIHVSYGFFFGAFHWHSHRIVVLDPYYYRHHRGYYRARSIARDARVRTWRHNPVHRRGVAYRDVRVSRIYANGRAKEVRPATSRPGANRVTVGNTRQNLNRHEARSSERLRHRDRAGAELRPEVRDRSGEVRQRLRQPERSNPALKPVKPQREKPRVDKPVRPSPGEHRAVQKPAPKPQVDHYRTPPREQVKPAKPRTERRQSPQRERVQREKRSYRVENKGRGRGERERRH